MNTVESDPAIKPDALAETQPATTEEVVNNLGLVAANGMPENALASSLSGVGAETNANNSDSVATPKPPTWKDWKQAGEGKSPQEIQKIGDARRYTEREIRRQPYVESMNRL